MIRLFRASLSGGNRELVPPDPIPNSEVKRLIADDSVGLPHVKVGHCQTLIQKALFAARSGLFSFLLPAFIMLLVLLLKWQDRTIKVHSLDQADFLNDSLQSCS